MKLCRLALGDGSIGLGLVIDDQVFRIDGTASGWDDLAALLRWSVGRGDVMQKLGEAANGTQPVARWTELVDGSGTQELRLLAPLDRQEVWAAGVTYLRSRQAREEESKGSGIYDRVYDAERPEIFFKATPSRVSGPNDAIRIRQDTTWNVPEPELALVMNPALEIVGYTVGNDVSSRDIEGANPLYLPQAKVYRQCCALGPAIALAGSIPSAADLPIHAEITRTSQVVWTGDIRTSQMKRSFSELVDYLGRDNLFPDGVVLMTGTGLVPPDSITLQADDTVTISIDGIGTLRNVVVQGET
ncbi:MAG TPA: fumarylacetoacetate hydrolase family protein [Herpetosiphonaceae bacterium]|nr:fumarylacetoacetate hydrolase family protein [Herpetosiphonaceae bacterium]